MREHGLLHEPVEPAVEALRRPGPESDRALARIRRVREALREIVIASVERRPAAGRAIDTVNRVMLARQKFILVCGPEGALDHRHEGDAIDDVLARLAERVARQVDQPGRGPAADLRQRYVRLGLLRLVTDGTPAVVRHDHLRQPGEGGPAPGADP